MPQHRFHTGDPAINRNGRPKKGETMTEALYEYLQGKDKDSKKTRLEKLYEKINRMAMSGDTSAMKYIFDRIDGKPRETHKILGDNKEPLGIEFVIKKDNDKDNPDKSD